MRVHGEVRRHEQLTQADQAAEERGYVQRTHDGDRNVRESVGLPAEELHEQHQRHGGEEKDQEFLRHHRIRDRDAGLDEGADDHPVKAVVEEHRHHEDADEVPHGILREDPFRPGEVIEFAQGQDRHREDERKEPVAAGEDDTDDEGDTDDRDEHARREIAQGHDDPVRRVRTYG